VNTGALRLLWRRRLLPACLGLLGLNVAAFLAYTLPRSLQRRTLSEQAASLRAAAETERRQTAELRQQADVFKAIAEDLRRFYYDLLGTASQALLPTLEDVEKMASEPGLKPGHRSFQPTEVKGAPLLQVVILLPLTGTYRQLAGFIERVERSPRFLTVDRVQISRAGDQSASLSVELSAFFRAEPRESP
jgi:Tfp pilus assembly protein PilO